MKLVVHRNEFVALIGKIQSVVSQKPTIPILANILIEATNNQLIMSGTDLTVSMRVFIEAKVEEEGAITLPARRLFQLVREFTSPQVKIQTISPEIAMIYSGASLFKIQGMHKNEFPAFPDLGEAIEFTIETVKLKEMFVKVAFAAAREDSRQVLNGILVQKTNHLATFIGTDGKRLAKIDTAIESSPKTAGSYILPLKAVEEIVKILEEKEKEVKINFLSDKIGLEIGNIVIITKLLSGQYPDVSKVIPQKKEQTIALHREELISLLRQVALFTSEMSSSVRFSFSPGTLHLSATSGDIGEGKGSMPVNYSGPKFDIAFNPHFFLDILRHSEDETVNFSATDAYNPGLITDSSSAQFVIMPMRLATDAH
ncbi:MAG: DNA polymerase III subunit beta [Chlamydiae bacterium]|nr:DNA polymerase III subunit beta [Chlamydiota bacterium]